MSAATLLLKPQPQEDKKISYLELLANEGVRAPGISAGEKNSFEAAIEARIATLATQRSASPNEIFNTRPPAFANQAASLSYGLLSHRPPKIDFLAETPVEKPLSQLEQRIASRRAAAAPLPKPEVVLMDLSERIKEVALINSRIRLELEKAPENTGNIFQRSAEIIRRAILTPFKRNEYYAEECARLRAELTGGVPSSERCVPGGITITDREIEHSARYLQEWSYGTKKVNLDAQSLHSLKELVANYANHSELSDREFGKRKAEILGATPFGKYSDSIISIAHSYRKLAQSGRAISAEDIELSFRTGQVGGSLKTKGFTTIPERALNWLTDRGLSSSYFKGAAGVVAFGASALPLVLARSFGAEKVGAVLVGTGLGAIVGGARSSITRRRNAAWEHCKREVGLNQSAAKSSADYERSGYQRLTVSASTLIKKLTEQVVNAALLTDNLNNGATVEVSREKALRAAAKTLADIEQRMDESRTGLRQFGPRRSRITYDAGYTPIELLRLRSEALQILRNAVKSTGPNSISLRQFDSILDIARVERDKALNTQLTKVQLGFFLKRVAGCAKAAATGAMVGAAASAFGVVLHEGTSEGLIALKNNLIENLPSIGSVKDRWESFTHAFNAKPIVGSGIAEQAKVSVATPTIEVGDILPPTDTALVSEQVHSSAVIAPLEAPPVEPIVQAEIAATKAPIADRYINIAHESFSMDRSTWGWVKLGGVNGSGFDRAGNVVLNFSDTVRNGINDAHALLTVGDTAYEVALDQNGIAIIPADSELAQYFFSRSPSGKLEILGDSVKLTQDLGNGHFYVIASAKGQGVLESI